MKAILRPDHPGPLGIQLCRRFDDMRGGENELSNEIHGPLALLWKFPWAGVCTLSFQLMNPLPLFGRSVAISKRCLQFAGLRGFSSKALVNASISKMGHVNCKGCVRCFTSLTKKASPAAGGNPTARLLSKIDAELVEQTRLIEEAGEDLSVDSVANEFESFLQQGNWTLTHEQGNSLVVLTRTDASSGIKTVASFDVSEVVNGSMNEFENTNEADEEGTAQETASETSRGSQRAEADAEFSEDMEEMNDYASFPITLQMERPGMKSRLVIDCLAELADDAPTLMVEKVSMMPLEDAASQAAYLGPDYSTLDETLRQQFDKFVEKELAGKELVAFASAYGHAAEAREYQNWLESVKAFFK